MNLDMLPLQYISYQAQMFERQRTKNVEMTGVARKLYIQRSNTVAKEAINVYRLHIV